MVNRDEDQGSAAVKGIKRDFGSDTLVEWIRCDLGNLHEIKDVFTAIREKEDRLDLVSGHAALTSTWFSLTLPQLVLSAGINANKYNVDHDGIDQHFGVNWLGQFYATNLLYPLIRRTSKMPSTLAPRIIMESSELHRLAPSATKFDSLDDINNPKLGPTQLYGRSKLAMILGVKYGLLERVMKPNADNIYAIAVHPGAVSEPVYLKATWSLCLARSLGEYRDSAAVERRLSRFDRKTVNERIASDWPQSRARRLHYPVRP